LKPCFDQLVGFRQLVAPRTGAWIETIFNLQVEQAARVAPRTGAWIETSFVEGPRDRRRVAPRTGAWIETTKS